MEAVGLVLAVTPLVISALEHYKNGISTIKRLWNWEINVANLIRRLKAQQTHFRLNLTKLLKAAAPDAIADHLPEDLTNPFWTNPFWTNAIGAQVKTYLGVAFDSFQEHVAEYQICVKAIAKKLRHMNRPLGVSRTPSTSCSLPYFAIVVISVVW
jgi:hypothetical protein